MKVWPSTTRPSWQGSLSTRSGVACPRSSSDLLGRAREFHSSITSSEVKGKPSLKSNLLDSWSFHAYVAQRAVASPAHSHPQSHLSGCTGCHSAWAWPHQLHHAWWTVQSMFDVPVASSWGLASWRPLTCAWGNISPWNSPMSSLGSSLPQKQPRTVAFAYRLTVSLPGNTSACKSFAISFPASTAIASPSCTVLSRGVTAWLSSVVMLPSVFDITFRNFSLDGDMARVSENDIMFNCPSVRLRLQQIMQPHMKQLFHVTIDCYLLVQRPEWRGRGPLSQHPLSQRAPSPGGQTLSGCVWPTWLDEPASTGLLVSQTGPNAFKETKE